MFGLGACQVDTGPPKPRTGIDEDNAQAPTIESDTPRETPLDSVIIRGTGAIRVRIQGGAQPRAVDVGPDGRFCVDLRLKDGANDLVLTNLTADGKETTGVVNYTVERKANVTPPSQTPCPTGSGTSPLPTGGPTTPQTTPTTPLCGEADRTCCPTDSLEPSRSAAATRTVGAGVYSDLNVCSTFNDWIPVELQANKELTLRIEFDATKTDLDLYLYGPAPLTFDPNRAPPQFFGTGLLAKSNRSRSPTEEVTFRAPTAGRYFGYVDARGGTVGPSGQIRGGYKLTVSLR